MAVSTSRISERLREHGQGLIAAFPNESIKAAGYNDLDAYRAYFFRVGEYQELYYEYNQVPTADLDQAGAAVQPNYLGEDGLGQGDDILRVGNDDFHVYHFGYAPADPNLRVYESVSATSATNAALSRRGSYDGPEVGAGDDEGFVAKDRIENVYDPPGITERLSFRNDKDGEFLQFGFEAGESAVTDGTLYIVGRGYKLHPITDNSIQDQMLKDAVGEMEDREVPTVSVQVAGLEDYDLGTETPDSWNDSMARVLDYTDLGGAGNQTVGAGGLQ